MKVHNPEFVRSSVKESQYPKHDFNEIALAGRSNVGKSSLINKLINRKKLAKTSSTPGRTQTINFYNIDNKFYFVDLPGYGFAKVPKSVKEKWGEMIENYLVNRFHLTGIIHLIDARHKPTKDDVMMYDWIYQMDVPAIVVATKVDKVKKSKRNKTKNLIFNTLKLPKDQPFTFFSAETGEGKSEVWNFIKENI